MRIKTICIITILSLVSIKARTQAAKSIYAELGGPGLASLNFDTRFSGKNGGLGGRIGIGGGLQVSGTNYLLVPAGINYLLGKDDKNFLELGLGITYVTPSDGSDNDRGDDVFDGTFGHLWFGYRLQPIDQGVTFRAGICPLIAGGSFIPYYAGISVGYKF